MEESYRSLWALVRYVRPYWRQLALGLCALCLTSASVLSIGYGIRYLIDQGFAHHNGAAMNQALLVLMGVAAVLAVATFARFYLMMRVGELAVGDLRADVFRRLLSLSPGFFEMQQSGAILARLTNDITLIQTMLGGSFSMALRNGIILIGGVVMLIATSPMLALYMAIVVPLTVLPVIVVGRQVRGLAKHAQARLALSAAHAQETIGAIRIVQAFQQEWREQLLFQQYLKQAFTASDARLKLRGILTGLVIFLAFAAVGFVIWQGGHAVVSGRLTAGELSSFVFFAILVAGSIGALSEVASDLQRAAGAASGINELLAARPDIVEPTHPQHLSPQFAGDICFEAMGFHYPSRPQIAALQGIDFAIRAGEKIALVGASGAGKTTLFQLLLRFYDPAEGRILLGGVDIRALPVAELRQQFAYVPQEPIIFSGSVMENLRYGNPHASAEEIEAAAKAARAADFIERLPFAYETLVGERGMRLSGGERQRLSIARAMLRNPKILLLDEATNALDAENEKLVQEALETLMQGRTTLMIAHRLATVLNSDRIVMLDKGRIEAIGTHEELVKRGSLYARLAELQFNNATAA